MNGITLLTGFLLALYPLLMYLGFQWFEPGLLGLALVGVYLMRTLVRARTLLQRGFLVALAGATGAVLWFANSEFVLRLLPATINLALAGYFGYSLYRPPTFPARMAALQRGVAPDELPPPVLSYTSQVTWLWVVFFIVNATVSVLTASIASREVWTLYNGLIAYGAIGGLFIAEYAYRRMVFHKKHPL